MSTTRRYCAFRVGDLLLGVPVECVQEVLRPLDITFVPLAPPAVSGLINLRGEIVTAIDLRCRLGIPARAEGDARPMNVVVRAGEGPVSLLVDDIVDVIEVSDQQFEMVPETAARAGRDLFIGVYKLEKSLLLALDPERATQVGLTP